MSNGKKILDDSIDFIKEIFKEAWKYAKRIWVKIVNFFKNIVAWFKNKDRIKKLQEDKNKTAVIIKEKLDNGDYNVCNCLFDTETNTLDDSEIIQAENLDNDTKNKFGNQDMIILT